MKKFILIALVLASSACGSFAAVIPVVGPVLPQPPHPGRRLMASSICTGEHQEFCLVDLNTVLSRSGEAYAFACPVRGRPAVGIFMESVLISAKGGHPGREIACAETPYATEMGFMGVKKGESVAIAYVLFDEASGQYVVDMTCSYTLHRNRRLSATAEARCS